MLYFLIALFSAIISGKCFKQACGTISIYRPNMMSWIYYYEFVLLTLIGSVLVACKVDNHYMINKLMDDSSRIVGLYAIIYTLVFFPLGMKFANFIFHEKRVDLLFKKYTASPIQYEKKYNDHNVRILLILLSGISVCSVIYVLCVLGDIPFLRFFETSKFLNFTEFRIEASRNFQGNEYIKNLFALSLTPILSYVAYGYKLRDNTFFTKVWFYVMFLFTVLILTYNFEKAPILFYLLGFVFYRVYWKGSISKKMIVVTCLSLFILIVGMYSVLMFETNVDFSILFNYNSGIFGRLLLSQGAGTFLSFDMFPDVHSHIGLSSISEFMSNFLNLEYSERSSRVIMEQVNPNGVKMGVAGVMNSLFIAEAWANFGICGVIVAPLYVGFLIQSLYLFFLKSNKSPFLLALFVSFSIKSSITGGFNDYVYNVNFLFLLLVFLGVYGIAFFIKRTRSTTIKIIDA